MGFAYLCLFSLFCTDLYLFFLTCETSLQFVCLPVCHFVLFWFVCVGCMAAILSCCLLLFCLLVSFVSSPLAGWCDITGLLWHCPLAGPIRLQHPCDDVIAALWLGEPCVSAYVVHAVAPPTSYSMRHAERSDTMLFWDLVYMVEIEPYTFWKPTDFSCSNLPMPTPSKSLGQL